MLKDIEIVVNIHNNIIIIDLVNDVKIEYDNEVTTITSCTHGCVKLLYGGACRELFVL